METKREEHKRLQDRTEELREQHEELSVDLMPFNQADHDEHNQNLRKHRNDLAAHKLRDGDEISH